MVKAKVSRVSTVKSVVVRKTTTTVVKQTTQAVTAKATVAKSNTTPMLRVMGGQRTGNEGNGFIKTQQKQIQGYNPLLTQSHKSQVVAVSKKHSEHQQYVSRFGSI